MLQRLVIIGAGFAGMHAALASARLHDANSVSSKYPEIALVAPEPTLVVRRGAAGAVFTRGWDKSVEMTGDEAKATKVEINTKWIYPPAADREASFATSEWARLVDY